MCAGGLCGPGWGKGRWPVWAGGIGGGSACVGRVHRRVGGLCGPGGVVGCRPVRAGTVHSDMGRGGILGGVSYPPVLTDWVDLDE